MSVAVALRITATLSPEAQATYSMAFAGSIGEVVMLAVGLEPMAKWQCAAEPLARRSMVTPVATAVDCTLVALTVITWVVPSIPKVVSCPLSSRNSLLIVVPLKVSRRSWNTKDLVFANIAALGLSGLPCNLTMGL